MRRKPPPDLPLPDRLQQLFSHPTDSGLCSLCACTHSTAPDWSVSAALLAAATERQLSARLHQPRGEARRDRPFIAKRTRDNTHPKPLSRHYQHLAYCARLALWRRLSSCRRVPTLLQPCRRRQRPPPPRRRRRTFLITAEPVLLPRHPRRTRRRPNRKTRPRRRVQQHLSRQSKKQQPSQIAHPVAINPTTAQSAPGAHPVQRLRGTTTRQETMFAGDRLRRRPCQLRRGDLISQPATSPRSAAATATQAMVVSLGGTRSSRSKRKSQGGPPGRACS